MRHKDSFFEFQPVNSRARTRFRNTPQPFSDVILLEHAKVVDIPYKSGSIFVISQSPQLIISTALAPRVHHFQDLYRDLPPEIQRIIGVVDWPEPKVIIDIAESVQSGMAMGVSDGSVRAREDRSSQSWIISAPNGSEITGMGPVDGALCDRTSHRAELQGHAAIFIILSMLVQYFKIVGGKLTTYCDNEAVVKKFQKGWSM
eukprot:CAMPEP_0172429796 /NCGR_PEP_ID=MMETSP1064-20121228/51869_1 /TAXON_ID=202472 /ORGANISM="Aulacoseira subarctica , Strain CCAP 1002/5" /LENGTH=201 /DNA_ID=CAMNT_0013175455 /DNA_START=317 /DNA_END=922 /DNA_ORIENTATION=-